MNSIYLDATRKYIIYCNTEIGIYSIYEYPYFYLGEKRCGLIMSSSSKAALIDILKESRAKYIETEEYPEKMSMNNIRKMFKDKYNEAKV